jgi:CSLREA domain-containing protein
MRIGAGVAAAVFLALAGAPHAAAATFTVTRTDDPAPDGCMPMDCSLREAILSANAGDYVSLPAGHYRLTIPGQGEDAGAQGDLDLTKDVTIAGPSPRSTVVDAQGYDRVFDVASGVSVQLNGLTVTGGLLPGDGGGIRSAGNLFLEGATVTGNRASGLGGGLDDEGTAFVDGSTIAGNQGGLGGGLHVGGMAYVVNSTISGNLAGGYGSTGHGGGIDGSGGTAVHLQSSTVTGNQSFNAALSGGGISSAPFAAVESTIIANNVAHTEDQTGSAASNCDGPVDTHGHNLSDTSDCGLDSQSDQQGVPVALGPLADNGGWTDTVAILAGSAAVDTGAGCPINDQRGVSRPRDRGCDIGAYELAVPLVSTEAASSVAFSTATLNGAVNPSYHQARAWFEYGRTTAYGSQTPLRFLAGNSGVPVTEPLTGLRQGVEYHFRLVAMTYDGLTISGADQTFTTSDRTKPVLTVLRVVPGLFHRKNGATLAFTLSENATVTLRFDHVLRGVRRGKRCVKITRFNRRRRPCTRYLPVSGSVVQSAAEGPNSIHWDAKVGTKLLTFGAYRLRATPRDAAGNVGKTTLAAFRVLR